MGRTIHNSKEYGLRLYVEVIRKGFQDAVCDTDMRTVRNYYDNDYLVVP